jgi:ATP-dependent Clp protease protease subunit
LRPIPKREGPLLVPLVDVPRDDPAEELFARRRVLISGPIDAGTANRVMAELMALDGRSADRVELVVNSDGGRLADVVPVLDVIGLMRAPVRTVCIGRAIGTAAVLIACGTGGRRSAAHARISLRQVEPAGVEGSSRDLRWQLDELELLRRQVLGALARATGRPLDELAEELDHGELLDPEQAAASGLIDPPDE